MAMALRPLPNIQTGLNILGLATASYVSLRIFREILIYVRPSGLKRYAHKSRKGEAPWAMVTGATGGIGRAFAEELAADGFNVVLHGRGGEKLSRVMAEFQATFPAQCFKPIAADPEAVPCKNDLQSGQKEEHTSNTPDFQAIQRELQDIRLTVLINNVGAGPTNPHFLPLADSSEARITANISLNALFPIHLTRVLLPTLKQHSPSLVINISSLADKGLPNLLSYGASKAAMMTATKALRLEAMTEKDDIEFLGIRVGQCTGAAGLDTEKVPESIFCPSAQTMAKAALARAGHGNGVVLGYWGHALQQWLLWPLWFLPQSVEDRVMVFALSRAKEQDLHGDEKVK
ncbi:short chain dehydrogenase [Xylariaceae sp. FL1272]|nr:short chain dehydrogenase [Xylariaceae sp. FL1272]